MGALPFKPGQIIGKVPVAAVGTAKDITDAERALLSKAGFRDGDPIPDLSDTQLGARLRAEAERVRAEADNIEGLTPVDPRTEPLTPPKPVPIESLPKDKQDEIYAAMDEMQELRVKMAASRPLEDDIPADVRNKPGAVEAIRVAREANRPGLRIIDDIKEKEIPSESSRHSSHEQDLGGALPEHSVTCPRCAFDLNAETVVPELADKIAYEACLLGKDTRFRKKYSLFGGRIEVVFGSLFSPEVDMVADIVDKEMAEQQSKTLVLYVRRFEYYKMAVGIESIQRKGEDLHVFEPVTCTNELLAKVKELNETWFPMDSVRNAVGGAWGRFNELFKFIEANAEDPAFFAEIE